MDKFIAGFFDHVSAGNIWLALLIIFSFYFLKNKPFQMYKYFDEKKSKNLDQALALCEGEGLSCEAKNLINEYVERIVFQQYSGISTDKKTRGILYSFYEEYRENIGWINLRRAYRYMNFDDSTVKVKMSIINHIGRWFVTVFSWLMGLYGSVMIIFSITFIDKNQNEFIVLSSLGAVVVLGGVVFGTMNLPYHSAVKIEENIKKYQKLREL